MCARWRWRARGAARRSCGRAECFDAFVEQEDTYNRRFWYVDALAVLSNNGGYPGQSLDAARAAAGVGCKVVLCAALDGGCVGILTGGGQVLDARGEVGERYGLCSQRYADSHESHCDSGSGDHCELPSRISDISRPGSTRRAETARRPQERMACTKIDKRLNVWTDAFCQFVQTVFMPQRQ